MDNLLITMLGHATIKQQNELESSHYKHANKFVVPIHPKLALSCFQRQVSLFGDKITEK